MDTESAEPTANGDGHKDVLAPAEEGPRDSLINTAVKFLQHPKVSSSPLYQKKAFLEKKGLTPEEINLAIQKAGVVESADHSEVVPTSKSPPALLHHGQPPYMFQVPPQSGWAKARDLAMTTVIVASVSYGIYHLFQKYLRPLIFGKNEQEKRLDRLESQITEIHKLVGDSLAEVNLSLSSIKASFSSQQMTNQVELRGVTDLKADINSLKGLLLSRNQFPPAPTATPVLPSWQRTPNPASKSPPQSTTNGMTKSTAAPASSDLIESESLSEATLESMKGENNTSSQANNETSDQGPSQGSDPTALSNNQQFASDNPISVDS